MSIDLEHLNSADITDTNLGDFLAAIDAALTASEYTKVKKAIEQIYAIALIPGTTIDVDKNGNNSIDINPGETANLTKIAKEIYEKVQNDINDTSKTNSADRDALIDEMNKYLTGIFNQQSLTAELISRGFSIEDFSKAIDNANKTSESRIKDLQRERDAKKRKAETILGKDELISTGNFTKKSIPTQLEDLKNAEDYFVFVENLLKKLEKAIADRNAATDKTVYDKFISDVEGRLKYTVNRIKELKIENLDNSDLDKLADTSEVTNSLAAGGTLENLRSEIEVKKTTVYAFFKTTLENLSDPDKQELGLKDKDGNDTPIAAEVAKLISTNPAEREESRAKISEHLKSHIQGISSQYDIEIKREKRLIELRKQNIDQYKEDYDKIKAKTDILKPKTKTVHKEVYLINEDGTQSTQKTIYIQVMDPNTGKPVYEDISVPGGPVSRQPKFETEVVDGQTKYKVRTEDVIDMEEITIEVPLLNEDGTQSSIKTPYVQVIDPGTGKPVYENGPATGGTVTRVPKFETEVRDGLTVYKTHTKSIPHFDLPVEVRQKYLEDFDKNVVLEEIKSLSKKEKKEILAQRKIKGIFGTFFYNRLWKKHKVTEKLIEERKAAHIREKSIKDYEELVQVQEAHQSQFENIFTRIKNSAPIQHVLYSLGKAFGRNQDSDANKAKKQEVLTDMQNSAYEEFLYQTAKTDKDELKDIRVNKGDNRYNTVSRNNTHQPLNNDFQFKDSDDDLEL